MSQRFVHVQSAFWLCFALALSVVAQSAMAAPKSCQQIASSAQPAAKQPCVQAACQAFRNCEEKIAEGNAQKSVNSQLAAQQVGEKKIKMAGNKLAETSGTGAALDKQSIDFCQAEKQKGCEKACSAFPDEKKKCNSELEKLMANSKDSKEQLDEAKKDSESSEQAAGGEMPQMGQGSGDSGSGDYGSGYQPQSAATPDADPTPTSTASTAAPKSEAYADCASDSAYLYEKCASQLESQCVTGKGGKPDYTSPKCANFASRYCATQSSGSGAGVKSGSGVSSTYCKARLASNYDCSKPGRAICPSCGSRASSCRSDASSCLSGVSQTELTQMVSNCSDDPMFADPGMATAMSTAMNSAATAGIPGGGGGGALGGLAGTELDPAKKELRDEFLYKLDKNDMNVGGGGGGGGGSRGSRDYNYRSDRGSAASAGRKITGRLPVEAGGEASAKDIERRFGASIFTITSEVMKDRCTRGLFNPCFGKK